MAQIIYTDGHCNGANGIGGLFPQSGYTALLIDSQKKEIHYIKKDLTNNEAELLAIFHALSIAKHKAIVYSDSMIAITNSLKGSSKEARFELICIANRFLIDTKKITLKWVNREDNPIT